MLNTDDSKSETFDASNIVFVMTININISKCSYLILSNSIEVSYFLLCVCRETVFLMAFLPQIQWLR